MYFISKLRTMEKKKRNTIIVIVISVVKMFGGYLQDAMTKASCAIVDKVYVEGENPGEGTCESK